MIHNGTFKWSIYHPIILKIIYLSSDLLNSLSLSLFIAWTSQGQVSSISWVIFLHGAVFPFFLQCFPLFLCLFLNREVLMPFPLSPRKILSSLKDQLRLHSITVPLLLLTHITHIGLVPSLSPWIVLVHWLYSSFLVLMSLCNDFWILSKKDISYWFANSYHLV